MSLELWVTYLIACIAIVIVPGPAVSLIVANSVRYGQRAGLANVAGIQLGTSLALTVLVVGLASVMSFVSQWFEWFRLAGAAYLVWLGFKLLRSNGQLAAAQAKPTNSGFFTQGFLVSVTNPKMLLFFGAFIPQFVDPDRDPVYQLMVLGLTFIVVATLLDSGYAILVGNARNWLSQTRVRFLERVSGLILIGGGIWMALARR